MRPDVRAVANYIHDKAIADCIFLDHMKLQKLAYIAHGWHLAITGQPLFFNRVEAWKYGPVIPDLYQEFRESGAAGIDHFARRPTVDGGSEEWTLDGEEESKRVIDGVWNSYKQFSGVQLSSMTHQKGTPWALARTKATGNRSGPVIDPESIRKHYLELAAKNRERKA
jgi:uncharacterized phage-associated protein